MGLEYWRQAESWHCQTQGGNARDNASEADPPQGGTEAATVLNFVAANIQVQSLMGTRGHDVAPGVMLEVTGEVVVDAPRVTKIKGSVLDRMQVAIK